MLRRFCGRFFQAAGPACENARSGVGIPGGCEAAVHATRRFMATMPDNHVVVKLDFSNAFNCIQRDVVLQAIADTIHGIYQFCHLAYQQNSVLNFGQHAIYSQEGVQQGDPLGPLQFCLAVHPLLSSMTSSLNIGYMNDFTLGGPIQSVAADVATIRSKGITIGLTLNPSKCEVISKTGAISHPQFESIHQTTPDSATLLGAPLTNGLVMDKLDNILVGVCDNFKLATQISFSFHLYAYCLPTQ